jgi:hypothetical protein
MKIHDSVPEIACCQLPDKIAIIFQHAKPLSFPGILPCKKAPVAGKTRRIRWRDLSKMGPLVDIREIPRENRGIKDFSGKDIMESSKKFRGAPGRVLRKKYFLYCYKKYRKKYKLCCLNS